MENEKTLILGASYEEGYLQRSLGSISADPLTSLTELVANTWDAGASKVEIHIPDETGELLSITDNGTGMTRPQFLSRWMKLGYNRIKTQGMYAEFPDGREGRRLAFGRSGVGRHGLLCFSHEYKVITQRQNEAWEFVLSELSGSEPFGLISERKLPYKENGTRLEVTVDRNLPDPDEVRNILSARFLHDPSFSIAVNGTSVDLTQLSGFIEQNELIVDGYRLVLTCVDSSRWARRKAYHGVAFWVGNRLVGEPSWQVGRDTVLDGRTRPARRFSIIVQCDELIDFVRLPDWSGFRTSEAISHIQSAVVVYANNFLRRELSGHAKETKLALLRQHRPQIEQLDTLGQVEITEFLNNVTYSAPSINADSMDVATSAVINLLQSRSGKSLLSKLSELDPEDVEALDTLLEEWSARDVLVVLREIDKRLSVIEALDKLVNSPLAKTADELHTVHPLVTHARWLFGPQYESEEYIFNKTVKKALEQLFGEKVDPNQLYNPKHRPDLICLAESTLSVVATEKFRESGDLVELDNILIVEVKKADKPLTRIEINQAEGYVEDLVSHGLISGSPFVNAFVVGKSLDNSLSHSSVRSVGEQPKIGRVEACAFDQLIRTAERRLFRLRENLSSRYEDIPALDLINQILNEPRQAEMEVSNSSANL